MVFLGSLYSYSNVPWANVPDSSIVYKNGNQPFSKLIYLYDTNLHLSTKTMCEWNNVWTPTSKSEYTYDGENLLSEINSQVSSGTINYKNLFTYTTNGDFKTQEFYLLNSQSNQLIGEGKFEYFYNSHNNPDSVIEYSNTNANQWMPSAKYIYGYTYDTIQSSSETYKYDTLSSQWRKFIKNIQTYDYQAQMIVEENYISSNDEWAKYSKIENSYQNGKLVSQTTYKGVEPNWILAFKTEIAYDNDKILSKKTSIYDIASSSWKNAFKDSCNYSTDGKLNQELSYKWDGNNWKDVTKVNYDYTNENSVENYFVTAKGKWVGAQKSVTKSDANGNISVDEKYAWDYTSNSWIPASKLEQTFQSDINKLSIATKYQLGSSNSWLGYSKQEFKYSTLDDSSIALKELYNYTYSASNWNETEHIVYYYKTNGSSINNIESRTSIYWADEKININVDKEIKKVSVYLVNGAQKFIGKSQEISTNGWERGIYIVKVETIDGKNHSEKIRVY